MKKVVILVVIILLLMSWVSIAYTDYGNVAISFDKPVFCFLLNGADDGGSGKYVGLGYSFVIEGGLDSDGRYQVDKYTYKVFGITIQQGEASPEK